MSIIGRIIGLLLVVALAFGITWCATHWSKVQAESQKVWDKLFGKKDQQEQVQPTPSEEQFSLDGLYYTFDFDGYIRFFRFKDNQFGNIERGGARGPDDKTITEIYLPSDWETQELTESYHTTEDAEYIRAYCKNPDSQDFVFAIYDKATKKLYYDFSNGEQLPGKTYEEQMLIEMVKFDKFVIHDHVHGRRSVFKEPTCTESGVVFIYCEDCRDICDIEYPSSLGHDYVGGKCTRCGESDPNYVEACEHDWVEDLSYVPTAPSCGEYWDTQYKCSKCNETKLEKNGPLPHDWVDGVCSRCGTQCQHVHENGHICPICGCEVEKKLTWRVGKPATCTENGVEYGDCICGYNSEMREIPALGHDYVNGVCTRCGEEVALTWLINEKPDYQGNETLRVTIPLIAGGNSYDGIQIEPTVKYPAPACIIRFSSGLEMYNGKAFWSEFADRTITFETAPSGDLLAWLQANATPQA